MWLKATPPWAVSLLRAAPLTCASLWRMSPTLITIMTNSDRPSRYVRIRRLMTAYRTNTPGASRDETHSILCLLSHPHVRSFCAHKHATWLSICQKPHTGTERLMKNCFIWNHDGCSWHLYILERIWTLCGCFYKILDWQRRDALMTEWHPDIGSFRGTSW